MDARLEAILTAILLDIRLHRNEGERFELNERLGLLADSAEANGNQAAAGELRAVARFMYGADADALLGLSNKSRPAG